MGWVRTRRRGDEELSPHQEKEEMRERVWGSPDVGRAPGCIRTQGTLPGSIWKRGMWRGVAKQSQEAQDAWDAGDASLVSGRNADGSDAGSVFADVPNSFYNPFSSHPVYPDQTRSLPSPFCTGNILAY